MTCQHPREADPEPESLHFVAEAQVPRESVGIRNLAPVTDVHTLAQTVQASLTSIVI